VDTGIDFQGIDDSARACLEKPFEKTDDATGN
jgi:hypothetical protein